MGQNSVVGAILCASVKTWHGEFDYTACFYATISEKGGTPMFMISKLTPDAKLLFDELSPLVQSNLVHGGANITTREDLACLLSKRP